MKQIWQIILPVAILIGMPGLVNSAGADVIVETSKEQYTTGDDVIIKVRNELTEPIYYQGMCSISDCTKVQEEWRCEDAYCDAPRQVLLAGEEKEFVIKIIGLIVGDMKYRFEYTTAIMERNHEAYSNPFFIISTGEPERMTISQQVRQFPVSERSRNPRVIAVNSSDSGRRDNTYVARQLRNQDMPSNQEKIRQRKRQDRPASKVGGYGLAENEVILSVSGVPRKMRQSLINILTGEYPFIRSMEEVSFVKGVAQYFIQLDVNAEEFADRLEATRFSSFRLDLIRFSSHHIDCTLTFD